MERESNQTISEHETSAHEAALLEIIAHLQKQNMEQQLIIQASTMDNASQMECDKELSWSFSENDLVPASLVNALYKQLNPFLRLLLEQLSNAVKLLNLISV